MTEKVRKIAEAVLPLIPSEFSGQAERLAAIESIIARHLAALGIGRKEVLLRAAYDLLKRSTQDPYVSEATSILARVEDANCDGYCLMEDIAAELGLEDGAKPIPLMKEDDDD